MSSTVKIERYKGERQAQKGIAKMLEQGWMIQDQSSRKMIWRPTTGFFTHKQVHTVTFVRAA